MVGWAPEQFLSCVGEGSSVIFNQVISAAEV